jgi:hypothetical protein
MTEYNIYDIVRIVNTGDIYGMYQEQANAFGLTKFIGQHGHDEFQDATGTITHKGKHLTNGTIVYGVRMKDVVQDIIIDYRGMTKIGRVDMNSLPEELFTL